MSSTIAPLSKYSDRMRCAAQFCHALVSSFAVVTIFVNQDLCGKMMAEIGTVGAQTVFLVLLPLLTASSDVGVHVYYET
jgi:hypothetical protein